MPETSLRADAPSFVPQVEVTREPSDDSGPTQESPTTRQTNVNNHYRGRKNGGDRRRSHRGKKNENSRNNNEQQQKNEGQRQQQQRNHGQRNANQKNRNKQHNNRRNKNQKGQRNRQNGGNPSQQDDSRQESNSPPQPQQAEGLFQVQDENFPTISMPSETLQGHNNLTNGPAKPSASCWSTDAAKTLKANLAVEANSHDQEADQQDDGPAMENLYSGNVVLTFLPKRDSKPRKKVQSDKKSSQLAEESTGPLNSSIDPPESNDMEIRSEQAPRRLARSVNMTRLRDRWWDLLKKQPKPLEIQKESNASLDSDESDNDDISLVGVGEHTQQLVNDSKTVDESYLECEYPIHEAIRRDDVETLRLLLREPRDKYEKQSQGAEMSPVELCVSLHRPHLLRVILQSRAESYWKTQAAVHLAVKMGLEEIVSIFIDASMSNLLLKDEAENNAIHLACLPNASNAILPLCVKRMDSTIQSKALLQRNKKGQTPVHIACCRVDFVETFLQSCSYSLLSKVLSIQDDAQQTPLLAAVGLRSHDVVMEMLMWKGNNHKLIQGGGARGQCVLSSAVKARDVEMLLLLLDFSDSTAPSSGGKKGYDLDGALHTAVRMVQTGDATGDDIQLELVRCLIDNGANPCTTNTPSGQTALFVATEAHEEHLVRVIIKSYHNFLQSTRTKRRRDPFLQKQPESFFKKIEDREEEEKIAAVREALIFSLFRGRMEEELSVKSYSCAIALYGSSATIDRISIEKLKAAIKSNDKAVLSSEINVPSATAISHEASYVPPSGGKMKRTAFSGNNKSEATKDPLMFWALQMTSSTWGQPNDTYSCRTLRGLSGKDSSRVPSNLVVVSSEGESFDVHTETIIAKSAKIDAEIRFERMKLGFDSEEGSTTIQVPLNSMLCKWFLQHCYSGSILGPMPEDDDELCNMLLLLIDFANHYLCPSLAQECEMRLLTSEPRGCYCAQCCHHQPMGKHEAACTYLAQGPSLCISDGTCLDVLAACMEFESTGKGLEYDILLVEGDALRPSWLSDAAKTLPKPALELLQAAAALHILGNFFTVSSSKAFDAHFGDDPSSSRRESLLFLLHTCMGMFCAVE